MKRILFFGLMLSFSFSVLSTEPEYKARCYDCSSQEMLDTAMLSIKNNDLIRGTVTVLDFKYRSAKTYEVYNNGDSAYEVSNPEIFTKLIDAVKKLDGHTEERKLNENKLPVFVPICLDSTTTEDLNNCLKEPDFN